MALRPVPPQFDPAPETRARSIEAARDVYKYDGNLLPPLQLSHEVPEADKPSAKWSAKAGTAVAKLALNLVANKVAWLGSGGPLFFGGSGNPQTAALDAERADVEAFMTAVSEMDTEEVADGLVAFGQTDGGLAAQVQRRIQEVLGANYIGSTTKIDPWISPATPNGRPSDASDYADLFRTLRAPHADFRSDTAFARACLAGPNPMQILRVTELPDHFPVQEKHFALGAPPSDSLARALDEGRVFLCDYAILGEVLVPNTAPDGAQKYVNAPMALFAVPPGGGALRPVAIQCAQKPDAHATPILTPNMGWHWEMAKYVVRCADANVHEVVSHLCMTHLRTEAIVLATARHLAANHPLTVLLRPHFEGTLHINHEAVTIMLAPKGAIDRIFAGTIESIHGLAARTLQVPDYLERMLPRDLAARGVDDKTMLPDYPYRDDSLRIWSAIHAWIREYVGTYYHTDLDVIQDNELAAWTRALSEPVHCGGVAGFGSITNRQMLVDKLTHIVFTASAQHAAVNFPQWTDMSQARALSGGCWALAPSSSTPNTEQSWLDLLPPLQLAELQLEFLYLLGSVYHTQLGDYRNNRWPYGDALDDPAIALPLSRFRSTLEVIERDIMAINQNRNLRAVPYEHLLPSRIPQSINI